jgi:hypothetical protein
VSVLDVVILYTLVIAYISMWYRHRVLYMTVCVSLTETNNFSPKGEAACLKSPTF